MHATNRHGSLVLNTSKSRRKNITISRTRTQSQRVDDLNSLQGTDTLGFLQNLPARSRKNKGQQVSTHAPESGKIPPPLDRPGFAPLRRTSCQVPVPQKPIFGRERSSSAALFATAFCGNLVHKTRILLDTSKQFGNNTVFDTVPTLQQSRKQASAHNGISTMRIQMLKKNFSARRRRKLPRRKSAHLSESQKTSTAHKQDLASQMSFPTPTPGQPIIKKQFSFPGPPPNQPTTAHQQDLASQMSFPTPTPGQPIATNQMSFPAQLPDEVVRRRRVESAHGLALLVGAFGGAGSSAPSLTRRRRRPRIRTQPPKSIDREGSRRRSSFMATAKRG